MAFNPWQPVEDRPKSYYIIDNVLSAVVHGIGFGLSIAGLVIFVVRAAHSHSTLRVTTFAIYGACMILLYL
ncbi:MAG: hemolysin III family protein, partial [Lactobacillus delbrueckii]